MIAEITAKLIRRHPHVFGDTKVNSVGEVLENWEKLKAKERGGQAKPDKGVLGTLPPGLPALLQAATYQRRAARVGFDWPISAGCAPKCRRRLRKWRPWTRTTRRPWKRKWATCCAAVNWARWLKVDPESALRMANEKFAGRFKHMEAAAKAAGRALDSYNLEELDALWEAAKAA